MQRPVVATHRIGTESASSVPCGPVESVGMLLSDCLDSTGAAAATGLGPATPLHDAMEFSCASSYQNSGSHRK